MVTNALLFQQGLQKFIEDKKSTLKFKMDSIVKEALKDLKIGESRIEFEGDRVESNNIQSCSSTRDKRETLWKRSQGQQVQLYLYMMNCGSFLINYNFHIVNNHKRTSSR